ncbi:hypothetical protein ABGB16_25885 [Micromonospora sp. B11E3]
MRALFLPGVGSNVAKQKQAVLGGKNNFQRRGDGCLLGGSDFPARLVNHR